jgi:tRNA pseudouridine13 synthase
MTSPPDIDIAVGMELYASGSPPCRARIKAKPEDFQVEEALAELEILGETGPGLLPLYRVEKKGIDTIHLEAELADALKSRISFAGMKDKKAVAVQYATPRSARSERPQLIEGRSFRAELVGYVAKPLTRGSIAGNRFRLILRDCCPDIGTRIAEVYGLVRAGRVPNFYGLQRFGARGVLTHRVGRAIVARKPDEAVRILLCEPRANDDEGAAGAREALSQGRFLEGSRLLPLGQDVERAVARRLAERPRDFLSGLRAIPIRLRRLYTQAYQSYLFNRALSLAMKRGLDISRPASGDNWGEVSPDGLTLTKVHGVREPQVSGAVSLVQLVGYAYRNYGSRFDSCTEEAMACDGVGAGDFFVKEMQEASVEGGFRRPYMAAKDLANDVGEGTARLEFTLGRGEYATVLAREIAKPEDPESQGFA